MTGSERLALVEALRDEARREDYRNRIVPIDGAWSPWDRPTVDDEREARLARIAAVYPAAAAEARLAGNPMDRWAREMQAQYAEREAEWPAPGTCACNYPTRCEHAFADWPARGNLYHRNGYRHPTTVACNPLLCEGA